MSQGRLATPRLDQKLLGCFDLSIFLTSGRSNKTPVSRKVSPDWLLHWRESHSHYNYYYYYDYYYPVAFEKEAAESVCDEEQVIFFLYYNSK